MQTKLTQQGYIVIKRQLADKQLEMIENDLTIEPVIDARFKTKDDEDDTFNIYLETVKKDMYVIPRYYGIEKFGPPNIVKFTVNDLDKTTIQFNGELRPKQMEIMDVVLAEYCTDIKNPSTTIKPYGGTIITIPPGWGKTVLAINLICQLGLKALVIVNKSFLMNQWKDRIKQYSDATIGTIQQDNIDIHDKQIVVGMLQSISMKEYDKELLRAFPLIIYDECHHLGAKIFSKSLIKVQAPYYLGLSATPERKDKMDCVFKYFLGNIAYRGVFPANDNVKVRMYSYNIKHNNFKSMYNRFRKIYMAPTMITKLCKIEERNDFIVKLITDILKEEPERKMLVLTGRCNSAKNEKSVNHVKEISDRLKNIEEFKDNWGYYIGGMRRTQLEISSTKQIILGTYEMAQEGLDISDLDTLILASPLKGNITQTCGRILRGKAAYNPLIIDIVDQVAPFNNQARGRYTYYDSKKYACEFYEVADGFNNEIKKLDEPFLTTYKKQNDEIDSDVDPFLDD